VLRSATVPFFYDKKNGTVALPSTLERISEHAQTRDAEAQRMLNIPHRIVVIKPFLLLSLAAEYRSRR